jgi:type IV secretion system protein VirB9
MMLEFGAGERIENVSIGDALAWQVTPNRRASLLFIKPVEAAVATNMTVVTDQRRYVFELTASRARGPRGRDQAYVVRFVYPPEPVVVFEPPPPAAAARAAQSRLHLHRQPGLAAVAGVRRRALHLLPVAEAVSTPALFLLGADGSESIVNYGVREGFVVVEQLAPRFVLRNGKDVTTVINNGWREPTPGEAAPRPADARTAKEALRAGALP